MKFSTLLFALAFALPSFAQTFCGPAIETLPVRAGGRVKPLVVLAEEVMKYVTGKAQQGELRAAEAFCKLSFEALGLPSGVDLPVKVEHIEVKKLLAIAEGESSAPYSRLQGEAEALRIALAGEKENNAYKKELQKVMGRLQTVQGITQGLVWTFPSDRAGTLVWLPFTEYVSEARLTALRASSPEPFQAMYAEARADHLRVAGDDFMTEHLYWRLNPFQWALVASLIALIVAVAVQRATAGLTLAFVSVAIQLLGITLRVMVSGRAPITNMYETVMFSGLGALLFSIGFTLWKKEKTFLWGGLAYNVLCLMMMRFANGMLDAGISPLVPVLRDNFWLSTHVTTIILSYAALALSWMLANVVLGRQMWRTSADVKYQSDMIYTCLKFGVVMLATGIILGGVWADYSWGRFWGWDPKETWSLIVLLVYMAILHGKSTAWIPPKRFVPLVAGAFMSVMMAWFGVNYILATGLHSYGFSEGGAIFLGSFFAIQTGFLLLAHFKLAAKAER